MAHYTGPKNRLSRREGVDLFGKGNKLRRATVPPGQHGQKGSRKLSGYGQQLREKQKVRRIYSVMERQFRRYVENARKKRGATGDFILQQLEARLDNVVFRLGFAPTRMMARQLVSHRHVLVNSKILNIPSYQVRPQDTITLTPTMLESVVVKSRLENPDYQSPAWLSKSGTVGTVLALPKREHIDTPVNEQLIVEYYSIR